MFDTKLLGIAARRVGKFLDAKGIHSDRADELFGAAQLCLVELFARNPQPTIKYIVTSIDRAILRHWQSDRQLAIPPSTRRERVKRGEHPGDFKKHRFQNVLSSNGLRASSPPHWADAEQQWFAPASAESEWVQIVETYDLLYSLCRDDLDRAIVEARTESLSPAILDHEYLPPHVADVAAIVGVSARTVQRRLDDLERRYYRWADCRIPTRRQIQRSPPPAFSPVRPLVHAV